MDGQSGDTKSEEAKYFVEIEGEKLPIIGGSKDELLHHLSGKLTKSIKLVLPKSENLRIEEREVTEEEKEREREVVSNLIWDRIGKKNFEAKGEGTDESVKKLAEAIKKLRGLAHSPQP